MLNKVDEHITKYNLKKNWHNAHCDTEQKHLK